MAALASASFSSASGPPRWAWARSGQQPMLGGVANERALKPAYLFTGSDRPKIALALQRLRARVAEGEEPVVADLDHLGRLPERLDGEMGAAFGVIPVGPGREARDQGGVVDRKSVV